MELISNQSKFSNWVSIKCCQCNSVAAPLHNSYSISKRGKQSKSINHISSVTVEHIKWKYLPYADRQVYWVRIFTARLTPQVYKQYFQHPTVRLTFEYSTWNTLTIQTKMTCYHNGSCWFSSGLHCQCVMQHKLIFFIECDKRVPWFYFARSSHKQLTYHGCSQLKQT